MNDSFKLEDQNKNSTKRNSVKIKFLIAVILLVAACIFVALLLYRNFNYISKADSKKDYVYTVRKDASNVEDDTYTKCPRINLEGDKFSKINNAILENYLQVISQEDYDYNYEFNKSGATLSLKISYTFYTDNEYQPETFFKTYNINLHNGHIYTKKELLNKYRVSEKSLNAFLEYRFKSYYDSLVKYGYYKKSECDYNCYLKNRGITNNYLDDIHLYVNNGSLTLYKFFYTSSKYEEEEYFSKVTYRFVIKK